MCHGTFAVIKSGVKFQFCNHQRVKVQIIRDLVFADDAASVATSLKEAQLLFHRFAVVYKTFGFIIIFIMI